MIQGHSTGLNLCMQTQTELSLCFKSLLYFGIILCHNIMSFALRLDTFWCLLVCAAHLLAYSKQSTNIRTNVSDYETNFLKPHLS